MSLQNRKFWPPLARVVLIGLICGPAAAAQGKSESEQPPSGLDQLIEETLQSNPGLQEAWSRYRAALQRAPQAASLPDPMLTYTQAIRSVETRVGPQLNSVTLSQRFPWFGKLDLQAQGALLEAEARYYSFRALRRRLTADVKAVFFEIAYVDRALSINQQEQSLLDQFERLAQSQYAAGRGLQQSVIKIQAELALLTNRILLLQQQRESLIARVNMLRNRPPETRLQADTTLPDPPQPGLDLDALYRLAEDHRPEFRSSLALIDRAQQRIQLARRDYWPDFTVGGGFINVGDRGDPMGRQLPPPDNGKNAFTVSLGINLPIWRDKYDAGVLEATESLLAEKQSYQKLRNEVQLDIREEVIRLQTLREQSRLYRRVLIPQNEEALRSTEAAYRTGLVGVIDLLDSERTLLQLRLMEARLDSDQWKSLTRLELALGAAVPGTDGGGSEPPETR